LSALQGKLVTAIAYEQAIGLYERTVIEYMSHMAEVDRLKTETDGWKRAKSALSTLRTLQRVPT
jgi:hypothetical protein